MGGDRGHGTLEGVPATEETGGLEKLRRARVRLEQARGQPALGGGDSGRRRDGAGPCAPCEEDPPPDGGATAGAERGGTRTPRTDEVGDGWADAIYGAASPTPSLPGRVGRKGSSAEVTGELREPCVHMPDMPCSESL